jgi:methionyl-tRNA formyltransferase
MDLEVHQAVIDAKETESGCTIHEVTEEVDGGPVVVQKKVKVSCLLSSFIFVYGIVRRQHSFVECRLKQEKQLNL